MIIATDIDLTVFKTDDIWRKWLETMFGKKPIPSKDIDYNLDNYYQEEHKETGYTFTKDWFFDREDLYSKKRLSIIKSAADVCQRLKLIGHNVYGVSDCTKKNFVSKFVLCKSFYAMDKVFRTDNKASVKCDVFIDDRHKYLNQFSDQPEVVLIKYDTPYTQDEELLPEVKKRVITVSGADAWYNIYEIILKEARKHGEGF